MGHQQVTTSTPVTAPKASFVNDTIAAIATAEKFSRRQSSGLVNVGEIDGVVLVKNDSGSDASALDVLGISQPIILPSSDEMTFITRVAIKAVALSSYYEGKFVILSEPIASGKIGRGWISGICPAKINVIDTDHRYADIVDGVLSSSESGVCRILWQIYEIGAGKWALLRFGNTGIPDGTLDHQVPSWNHSIKKWQPDWVRSHW